MGTLNDKVAVVTGASKGIGAGIAERLAADGAKVVVNYARSADAAQALVAKIKDAGGSAIAVKADVSQLADIEALFKATADAFGALDILVNNAGIYEFAGLMDVTPEHFDRQYALNVKGLVFCTQAAVRAFGERGGVVVNISSGVALTPMPQAQIYSSTKGAVDTLTRGLALELGPRGIRVVGIAPGLTATEGTSDMDAQTTQYIVGRTPLGRLGTPKDIAAAVAFVASEDGAWITGETIQVGGGLLL